jgi:hypothetical protein
MILLFIQRPCLNFPSFRSRPAIFTASKKAFHCREEEKEEESASRFFCFCQVEGKEDFCVVSVGSSVPVGLLTTAKTVTHCR